jgi:hypothetical protein
MVRIHVYSLSRNENINVAKKYPRVSDGANGHYKQWVEACIAGHGKMN